MKNTSILFFCLGMIIIAGTILGCKEDDQMGNMQGEMEEEVMEMDSSNLIVQYNLNPSGFAPLSAILSVEYEVPFNLEVRVKGRRGANSDYTITKTENKRLHVLDVHGLYPGHPNTIEITAKDDLGNTIGITTRTISTEPLISDMPRVESLQQNLDEDHPIFYLVNYFGFETNHVPQKPFLVDQFGDIRWYLDFASHPNINQIYLDNGLFHMQNNDVVFAGGGWDQIYIADLFGNIKNTIPMENFTFHHTVIEKPDGNLLLTANMKGRPTSQDIILEIDPNTRNQVHVWDLTELLDQNRTTWTGDNNDWIHVNGVAYDEGDNTIIISGRTQGVAKLNYNDEAVWILAPHKDWSTAGNGVDLSTKLLQPLDANGIPITESGVLEGNDRIDGFDWNWYQHSPIVLPNGNFMFFDNGQNRNFLVSDLYSRAVEYQIDAQNMTVQQIWEFGKELGQAGYSRIVSKVTYLPELDHVTFTPGAVTENGAPHGLIYEIDKSIKDIKLEMRVTPPQPFFGITFHNAQRFEFK